MEIKEFEALKARQQLVYRPSADWEFKEDSDETGEVIARFATFGVIDRHDDIVEPGAIEHGKQVAMAWSHDTRNLVGRGVVETTMDQAIFTGKFFLDTDNGKAAYETTKRLSDLMEWSWGFKIEKAKIEEDESGKSRFGFVRRIQKTIIAEVSPVLLGAGINTGTLSLKDYDGLLTEDTLYGIVQKAVTDLQTKESRTLDMQFQDARDAIKELEDLANRFGKLVEKRSEEGKSVSEARYVEMQAILKSVEEVSQHLAAIATPASAEKDDSEKASKKDILAALKEAQPHLRLIQL